MLTYYRGHVIVLLSDEMLTAEITELSTRTPLPTKASARQEEGPVICVERAKVIVDLYIAGAQAVRLLNRGK
jgi:hypothetical protein